MSRILCLDSISQVCPSFMNFIARSLRKFSGLSIKLVLSPERLQKHSPKNFVELQLSSLLSYSQLLSTVTPISIVHKYNLTVVSNSHFSFAIDTHRKFSYFYSERKPYL